MLRNGVWAVLLASLTLTVAADDLAATYWGKWTLDRRASAQALIDKAPPQERKAMKLETYVELMPDTTLQVTKDRLLFKEQGRERKKAIHEVKKGQGRAVSIVTMEIKVDGQTEKVDSSSKISEYVAELTDPDTLKLENKEDETEVLVFKRGK